MSYDIQLYQRDFLRRALESNLGDWMGAPPIPQSARDGLVTAAKGVGFVHSPLDPDFVAFAQTQGHAVSEEYTLDSPTILAQLNVFTGEVVFSIPFSNRAAASIDLCLKLARQIAEVHALGLYDPQTGETRD